MLDYIPDVLVNQYLRPFIYSDMVSAVLVISRFPIANHELLGVKVKVWSIPLIRLCTKFQLNQTISFASLQASLNSLKAISVGIGVAFIKMYLALRALTVFKPDVLIGYELPANVPMVYILGKLWRKKVIAYVDTPPLRPLQGALLVPLLRSFDGVATTGSRINRILIEKSRVCIDRISTLPSAINTDRFKPGVVEKVYDIIFVGRIAPAKRIDRLLKVVSTIKELRSNVRCVIVGEGQLLGDVMQLCKKLGLESDIDFVGFRPNTELYYNMSKIFVLTSDYEGMPAAMLEAMACGLPCVVPDVGDIRDVVNNMHNGIVIQRSDDINAYASAIMRLLDSGDYQFFSANARRAIETSFTPKALAKSLDRSLFRWCFQSICNNCFDYKF